MPKLNRIYSFIAVGFVLVFLGKINKVSLFTAYFKTIADVEIRNTQGLEQGALALKVMVPQEASASQSPVGGGAILLAETPLVHPPAHSLTLSLSLVHEFPTPPPGRFLKACPVRGPDFS